MSTEIDLTGQTIRGVWIDARYLRFDTDEGFYDLAVEGDCCSWSYFYNFDGAELLFGVPVIEFRPVPLPQPDDEDSRAGDCVEPYGYEIETERGVARFSFRNDSNGYYGGWMCRVDGIPDFVAMTPVFSDWRATWRSE